MPPRTIAIFLPNPVGDVVMATPALRALRAHFAGARITYVGRSAALAMMSGSPWADAVIAEGSTGRPKLSGLVRTIRAIRRGGFDLAVLLPNSLRAAVLARLGGAARVAGYARGGRGWLLSDGLKPLRRQEGGFLPVPTIDYYLALARMLGAQAGSRTMELPVGAADDAAAEKLLGEAGIDRRRPVVMLNPGAAYGPSKLWPAERFAAVGDALVERHGVQIIINAAPAERALAAEVGAAMRHPPAISFADRDNSLGLLKGLIRRCRLLITTDTGARHVGAALGIGVVSLFGSTDSTWARIDYGQERIVRVDVPCGPCQRKACRLPPGPRFHQCMTALTVAMVLSAAEDLLRPAATGTGDAT